jgi:hypothetical protein
MELLMTGIDVWDSLCFFSSAGVNFVSKLGIAMPSET